MWTTGTSLPPRSPRNSGSAAGGVVVDEYGQDVVERLPLLAEVFAAGAWISGLSGSSSFAPR